MTDEEAIEILNEILQDEAISLTELQTHAIEHALAALGDEGDTDYLPTSEG